MFDSITIRATTGSASSFDMGLLGEAALFFSKINLVLDRSSLRRLIEQGGKDGLLFLLGLEHVDTWFLVDNTATFDRDDSYDFIYFRTARGDTPDDAHEVMRQSLGPVLGSRGQTRRTITKILRHVHVAGHEDIGPIPSTDAARQSLDNAPFVSRAISASLLQLAPSYNLPPNWFFRTERTDNGFRVVTNLDIDEINRHYHRHVSPSHSSITPASLVDNINQAAVDALLAAKHGAGISTSPIGSLILQERHRELVERATTDLKGISLFQDVVLNGFQLREAINSGERTITDLAPVIEKAEKFRDWLGDQPSDENAVHAYHRELTKDSWIDKLPGKTTRLALFYGAGLAVDALLQPGVGLAAGLTLNAADTFLLDKLANGWKPDQFVNGSLKKFAKQETR